MAQAGFRVDIADVTRGLYLSRTTVLAEIDKKLARGAQMVARTWRQNAPKAFSTYTQSISARRIAPLKHEVAAGVGYAGYQEEGTDGGMMPPIQSIADWIKVRSILPRDPSMRTRDLAFLIARKIARTGVPAQPAAEPALEANRAALDRLVAAGRDIGVRRAWGH